MAREGSGKSQASTLQLSTTPLEVQQNRVNTLLGTAKFPSEDSVNLTWFRTIGPLQIFSTPTFGLPLCKTMVLVTPWEQGLCLCH